MTHIPPDLARSPVFDQAEQPHPGLVRASSSWGMGAAVVGACVLGVVTFMSLSNHRTAQAQPAPKLVEVAAPAPVVPAPLPVMATPQPIAIQPAAPPAPPAAPVTSDPHAPAMVVDFSQSPTGAPAAAAAGPGTPPGASPANEDKLSADERFSAKVSGSSVDVAHASRIHDLSHTAPQGTVIPAVLETAINSDLPGFVRAVVSRDVRGFDGTTVLVPRGSKLIGQYRSGVALSQTRAFVVWSRIITPEGVSIDVGSPGTDQLGRGGLEGDTDTHFFARFGSAILLSVMGAGLEALTEPTNNNTSIIIGSQQQASQVANTALQKEIDIPVTIKVPQGTPVQVFLTRDLDFAGVATTGK
jgi:type IV secretory pathway VirB10-like protein